MMGLSANPKARRKCDEAIIITGVGRSGTTVMGQLVHSLEGVEYAHEPAMLQPLMALLDRMDRPAWELLYESYLFEEFLFSALAGRALNCNLGDQSSIYRVKDETWIQGRLSQSLRKRNADEDIERAQLVYKMTDIAPFIPQIQESYPHCRVVMVLRNANDVVHSILERQWFTDEMLRGQVLKSPNRVRDGMNIPFWVAPSDDEFWFHSDEIHRIGYFYLRVHRAMDKIKNMVTVGYDDLVGDPQEVVRDLADTLGLAYGSKTPELISNVKKPQKDREARVVDRLDKGMREEVLHYSSLSEAKVVKPRA